jgi:hypothetical protein
MLSFLGFLRDLASTALGQVVGSLFQEGLEFEKNILRHMEMDMNAAITYLQNKGFCLIPIIQATAISNRTGKPGSHLRLQILLTHKAQVNFLLHKLSLVVQGILEWDLLDSAVIYF